MMHSSDTPPRPHAKFIPSEEIAAFAAWNFGSLGAPLLALPDETVVPEEEVEVVPEEPVQVQLERAWDEGYAAGLAHGREEATNEGNHKLDEYVQGQGAQAAQSVASLMAGLAERLEQVEQGLARQVLDLAVSLARQVVRQELNADPNALLPVVREALGMLMADGKVKVVKLNPQDLDLFRGPLQEEFDDTSIKWLADGTVAPGDCLVESAGMVIDGGLAKRWERAVASLGVMAPWEDQDDDK